MITFVQKILETFKAAGIIGVTRKAKGYLAEKIYIKRYLWYEKNLLSFSRNIMSKVPIHFEADSKENVVEWISENIYFGQPYADEIFENKIAFANQHIFSMLKSGNEIVSYAKIGVNELYIKNFANTFRLRNGVSFVYAFYTSPQHRKQSLGSFLLCESIKTLKQKGINKIACHIRSSNIPSITVFEKLGFRPTGSIWQIRFFRIYLYGKMPKSLFHIN